MYSRGILFRIEDVDGLDPMLRGYQSKDYISYEVNSKNIDRCIAELIADEINGKKTRSLHSYSKSLATCLLKYNKYADNELHIYIDNCMYSNMLFIKTVTNENYSIAYDITERTYNPSILFENCGSISMMGFNIDVADNKVLDDYLHKYVSKGRKWTASPEKDNEVVVLNPTYDISIRKHMGAVYVIYALNYRYGFLSDDGNYDRLINKITSYDGYGCNQCNQELQALVTFVRYLHNEWNFEYSISKPIVEEYLDKPHISYYDGIAQLLGIIKDSFEETYNLVNHYQYDNIVLWALEICRKYLNAGTNIL